MEVKKNTYEFGLVVGTKRERDYWKNKIKEKIEEVKKKEIEDMFITATQGKLNTIFVLEELLKGE
jgi:hypothetical protein